jgi:hypothetical protein
MVRRRLAILVGLAVSLVITGLFFEAFLRYSGSTIPSIVRSSEAFGLLMKPDTDVVFVNEGFSLGKVNELGYLGPAYPVEKPAGAIRIALLGDSYVAGHHLFDRHHFRSLMEDQLGGVSSGDVEVLNFGFPAVNFEQMYIYHEVFIKRFSPDFVLYFIGTSSLNKPSDEVGPRLKLEADSLRIDHSFRQSGAFARLQKLDFLRQFSLYALLRKAKELYARGSGPEIILDKFYRLAKGSGTGKKAERGDPEEKPGRMPLNRAVVESLAKANARGPSTSIIVVRDGLPDTFLEFARSQGVLCLDPTPDLDSLAATGIDPHYWKGSQRNGHWNHYAHRVVADFLSQELAPIIN